MPKSLKSFLSKEMQRNLKREHRVQAGVQEQFVAKKSKTLSISSYGNCLPMALLHSLTSATLPPIVYVLLRMMLASLVCEDFSLFYLELIGEEPEGSALWIAAKAGASAYFAHMTTANEYGVYAQMGLVELKAFTRWFGAQVFLTSVTPGGITRYYVANGLLHSEPQEGRKIIKLRLADQHWTEENNESLRQDLDWGDLEILTMVGITRAVSAVAIVCVINSHTAKQSEFQNRNDSSFC